MTTTTTTTEVQRYAKQAVSAAKFLEQVALSNGDREETGEMADHLAAYGLDYDADWLEVLDTMALEVYGTKEVGPYRDNLTSITVITGTGGPHVEWEISDTGRITGRAYWGGEEATSYGHADLFDMLADLIDPEGMTS